MLAGINGGLAVGNLILSYAGSFNAEVMGRRALWLTSTIGMLVCYIIITGLSGAFGESHVKSVGIAIVPMLFIYYGFYDFGWTPLPCMSLPLPKNNCFSQPVVSYGAEILPYQMRLKGLSIMLSVQSVAQAFVDPLYTPQFVRSIDSSRTNGSILLPWTRYLGNSESLLNMRVL